MQGICLAMYGNQLSIFDAVFISIFAMSIVFVVLLIISYLIDATAFFVNVKKKKVEIKEDICIDTNTTSDSAIVATIAAAIASYMNTNVDNIIIKKIRRIK